MTNFKNYKMKNKEIKSNSFNKIGVDIHFGWIDT